jgi:hypothetical protein
VGKEPGQGVRRPRYVDRRHDAPRTPRAEGDFCNADIAAVSVEQARGRYNTLKGSPFTATFAALDCYTHALTEALSLNQLTVPFDVVRTGLPSVLFRGRDVHR